MAEEIRWSRLLPDGEEEPDDVSWAGRPRPMESTLDVWLPSSDIGQVRAVRAIGPWDIEFYFTATSEPLHVRLDELRAKRAEPETETAVSVRRIRQSETQDEVGRRLREFWGRVDELDAQLPEQRLAEQFGDIRLLAKAFKESPRPGRRGREDLPYARIARRYVELRSTGHPIQSLAEEMDMTASRVRDLVREARQRQLLTRTTRGVSGGELTKKAKEVLDGIR